MAPNIMVPCPTCGCHAKRHEIACPHCGERLRRADGTIPRTAAAILLGLTAVAVANCGSGGSSGGMGGMGGMDIVSTSHYGFGPTNDATTTTSTGNDPCATGADCTQCPDYNTCATCETGNHPSGSTVFDDIVTCVYCTACYTVCGGETEGCATAPATKDACDGAAADMTLCSDPAANPPTGCIPCSEAGTCKPEVDACKADMDCVAFNNAIQACPQN